MALHYARENASRFIGQLEDLTRIPSISTDSEFASDVRRAADWLATEMKSAGLQHVEVLPTAGQPVLYRDRLDAGADAPTVLLYAHYDVQPAVREDGWDTDPFEPTRKDGRMYARGIGDDKLHAVMIVKLAECFIQGDGPLPVSLKLVIEGEEEMGSKNFTPWVRENRERLSADYCLVCDGSIANPDQPTINYALRGLAALQFTVRGPSADLHSGIHGGRVHNPAQVVAEMVAGLHDNDGRVAVPGFYDEVRELTDSERRTINQVEMTEEDFKATIGAPASWGEPGYSLVERATARPTLEINGIFGGYSGEGIKTVIPAEASAKITCRLVADQRPTAIIDAISRYLKEIAPPTVTVDIEVQGTADPVIVPIESRLVKALTAAYTHHWDTEPQIRRIGGTVPIAPVFHGELGIPTLLLGFNVENAGFHGPNEYIHEDLFHKGLETDRKSVV